MYLFYIGLGIVVFGALLHYSTNKTKPKLTIINLDKRLHNFRTLRISGNELRVSQIQSMLIKSNTDVASLLIRAVRSYAPKFKVSNKFEVINETPARLIGRELYVKEGNNDKEIIVTTFSDLPEEVDLPSETQLLIATAERKGIISIIYLERQVRKAKYNYSIVGVQLVEPHGEITLNAKGKYILQTKLSHLFLRNFTSLHNLGNRIFNVPKQVSQASIEADTKDLPHLANVGNEELDRIVSHLKHNYSVHLV